MEIEFEARLSRYLRDLKKLKQQIQEYREKVFIFKKFTLLKI
jgi:hypothetical protein